MPAFLLSRRLSKPTAKAFAAFTIIEILVVVASMTLFLLAGISGFRSLQIRNQLLAATESFKADLRLARELALAGKKPSGCSTLNGYEVRSFGNNLYRIIAICYPEGSVYLNDFPQKNIRDEFPKVTLRVFTPVLFKVLGGGVNTGSNIQIILYDTSNNTQTVTVTPGGAIY
jgi:type II secretory pathway pseudopilin PulG